MTKQSVDSWVAMAEASGQPALMIEDITRMAMAQSAPDVGGSDDEAGH